MSVLTADEARRRAAEVREAGDASAEERAELRALIATKCVTDEWKQTFYQDVIDANGLSSSRAQSTLRYLRGLDDHRASDLQAKEIHELLRIYLAPKKWAEPLVELLDAGKLSYARADQMIAELRRLPRRRFVAPEKLPAAAGDFEDGYYAVVDASGKVRRYRVATRGGMREVWQITGDQYGQRHRVRNQHARDAIAAIGVDPDGAARRWGEETKKCSACNTTIEENPRNPGFPHGFGEKCWRDRQALRLNRDVKAEIADQHPEEPAA